MPYFIAIVPPEEYKRRILDFQHQWTDHNTEPHITVKAQGGLDPDLSWLPAVKKVCDEVSPFQMATAEPASFGSNVVFLTVRCEEIVTFHHQLVEAASPSDMLIQHYFEQHHYVPHLTLGQASWGLSEENLSEIAVLAKERLVPGPSFTITFVRVYEETKSGVYEPFLDIPLNGGKR